MAEAKPKLLIVEDDPGLQAQLKWVYDDFDVVIVGDRASAIAALRAEEPAVVTLDLGLPPDPDGTSEGFAVLDEIVALKPDTKVIVASGHGARASALTAIERGAYDFYQKQMAACDQELTKYMAAVASREITEKSDLPKDASVLPLSKTARRPQHRRKNQPSFDLATELQRTMGVDLTRIDGIDVMTAQVIFAEIGPDLSAFPDENHFASWLTLAPKHDISGGKVLRRIPAAGRNRVANALRMAAESLCRSNSYLGARYRRLRIRLDGPLAVKAMARYLACLVYRMVTKGQAYVDRGAHYYESKRQEKERLALQRRAATLGLKLVPAT